MVLMYRALTIFLISILLIWYLFPWGFAYGNGAVLALAWLGANSVFDREFIVVYSRAVVVIYVLIYAGLLFYVNIARYGLLVFAVLIGVASPFFGISVQSGYEGMLGYFQTLGDGVLIAMSFFTEIKNRFRKIRS